MVGDIEIKHGPLNVVVISNNEENKPNLKTHMVNKYSRWVAISFFSFLFFLKTLHPAAQIN